MSEANILDLLLMMAYMCVNPDHSKFKQSGQSRWRIDTKIEQSPLKDTWPSLFPLLFSLVNVRSVQNWIWNGFITRSHQFSITPDSRVRTALSITKTEKNARRFCQHTWSSGIGTYGCVWHSLCSWFCAKLGLCWDCACLAPLF